MRIDKKLLKYCLYATGTVLLIYIGITILNNIGDIFSLLSSTIGKIIGLVKPLLMALIIVYILKPVVQIIEKFLEKKRIFKKASTRRAVGILGVYTLVIAVFIAIVSGIYIMVGGKISNNITIANMTEYLTNYLKNSTLSVSAISEKLERTNISILGDLNGKIAKIVSYVQSYFSTSIGAMTNSAVSIGGNIASFFIAIVLSIYLIQDSKYFIDLWNKIFNLIFRKSEAGNKVKEILSIIDDTFYKYIRGQLLEACIVGVLSGTVLFFIGIDYALIIGVIAGICNMIPYIGPIVGTILAVIMALLSGQPITAVWATIGMIVVQQVDNNLLAPKIVGNSVGLHPVFTMLAIIIGGSLGGLIGMLIAVPIAASLKILISKWYISHMEQLAAEANNGEE
ncbi:AI-2E family transporter [Clostridium tagluense]|uniref:AI-2E family transporter n=1 Tax=Clostridium tagluense TaxID=360422 RepID=UPI001C0CB1C7|nr:AI-2E family transporter [Clostridium tagluense]MBU3128914.1 AI-2E family transporter [Clostridium tagluense]MCB2310312.1 AI-2E family transporter [Clostridium tagluense]MCB2315046.1 AI-2E family transporter [Clostridium tagluense]MCB2320012.1 AI-2E family transporter [Clostridium tagluense]MCB2324789.1 AI-2E family transporter [Clostridium tagluense]